MNYIRFLGRLIQLLWHLFPVVVCLVRFIQQEREKATRKKMAKEIVSAIKEASKTGDVTRVETALKGGENANT